MIAALLLMWAAHAETPEMESRLLGPEPAVALAEPPAEVGWSWLAVLGLGAAAAWGLRDKLRPPIATSDTAVQVLGRASLGDGTSVTMVHIDARGASRVLVLGTGSQGPTLLTEIFEEAP